MLYSLDTKIFFKILIMDNMYDYLVILFNVY